MRGLVEPSSNAALDKACEDISVSFTWMWQEGVVGERGKRVGQEGCVQ